ncbi:unnamed protein product [Bursaphelenchus okinawaensis]|uniref:Uncharacterized protein n=1 Tax=Bursaphelenchus okinawaensis TaxID=465554 RepID=A0A811LVG0_9BILA|nr:unnamed protein product [Bursaphelenchus okinawaensis]CAG9128287.1 unnamed protein product [Bursaphelenchus okinawaensis]
MKRLVVALLATAVAAQSRDAQCLGRCMNTAVSNSQRIEANQFTSICKTYEQTANCIFNCNQNSRSWWSVGNNLINQCNQRLDTAINRNQQCYVKNLDSAQSSCNRQCRGSNGGNLWNDQNQDRFCFNNNCFLGCLADNLNRRCSGAGRDLANVFWSPYDTIYNSPALWNIYTQTTAQVQPWCRPYFYGQHPGQSSSSGGGGGGVGISSVNQQVAVAQTNVSSGGQTSGNSGAQASQPTLPANQAPNN